MAKYIYGKTLHSLRWQSETNECVSATGFVKMLVCILTCCKHRVKSSYKQKEGGSIATSALTCSELTELFSELAEPTVALSRPLHGLAQGLAGSGFRYEAPQSAIHHACAIAA